jgi:hypothetical protein
MTAATVINALALPADSRVDQRVAKKLLSENGAPTASDKRHINDGIEELVWLAALKPATIGVSAYRDETREYLEIAVLSLTLRPGAKAARLAELVHRAIPYPVFLVLAQPDGLSLSLAHLRWSRGQSGQTVLEDSLVTAAVDEANPATPDFLASLNVTAQPRHDLRAFYQGWIGCFEGYAAAGITGAFTLCESPALHQVRRESLDEYDRLTREIAGNPAQPPCGLESPVERSRIPPRPDRQPPLKTRTHDRFREYPNSSAR